MSENELVAKYKNSEGKYILKSIFMAATLAKQYTEVTDEQYERFKEMIGTIITNSDDYEEAIKIMAYKLGY